MGIFDNIFTTQKEKIVGTLIKNKENSSFTLMHTSLVEPGKVYSFGPAFNNKLKQMTVFATPDEKTAILYALQPMYYFTFGNNEKAAIITGDNHSLLKLDNITAYIYTVDTSSFEPLVYDNGEYYNEWISKSDVHIREDRLVKKITFKDILKSGIQVFWVKDKNIVSEFDKQIKLSGFNNGNLMLDFLKDQANWYPDKVVYMNAYKKEGLAVQTESGWEVPKTQVALEEVNFVSSGSTNIKQNNLPPNTTDNSNRVQNRPIYNIPPNYKPPVYTPMPNYNPNNGGGTQNTGYQNPQYNNAKSYQRRKAS